MALEEVLAAQQAASPLHASHSDVSSSGRLRLVLGIILYLIAIVSLIVLSNGAYSYCRLTEQPPTFLVPTGMSVAVVLACVAFLCLLVPALALSLSGVFGASITAGCGGMLKPKSIGCILAAAFAIGAVIAATWPVISAFRCKGGHATTSGLPDILVWISAGLASAVATLLAHYAWS